MDLDNFKLRLSEGNCVAHEVLLVNGGVKTHLYLKKHNSNFCFPLCHVVSPKKKGSMGRKQTEKLKGKMNEEYIK